MLVSEVKAINNRYCMPFCDHRFCIILIVWYKLCCNVPLFSLFTIEHQSFGILFTFFRHSFIHLFIHFQKNETYIFYMETRPAVKYKKKDDLECYLKCFIPNSSINIFIHSLKKVAGDVKVLKDELCKRIIMFIICNLFSR